ncbi:hypothetical protein GCM10027019_10130 [Melaminivora jejuensis]|uniref:hypothetical protein n=1 Tax=Melaminivora jejuensis TaxID=1267217 RepID=UPI001AE024EC|nr:hypothetical protein [Melaminivora jejuensis]UHJ64335.1 hypothetical protein LVC68_13395 [Melaminivora jejuensis]
MEQTLSSLRLSVANNGWANKGLPLAAVADRRTAPASTHEEMGGWEMSMKSLLALSSLPRLWFPAMRLGWTPDSADSNPLARRA